MIRIIRRNIKYFLYLLWFLVQCSLCFLLYKLVALLLYSGNIYHLFLLMLFPLMIVLNCFLSKKFLKTKLYYIIFLIFSIFSSFYFIRIGKAFVNENSRELLILSEKYGLKNSKIFKSDIEQFFEYDTDGIQVRDVFIDSFYETDGNFVLNISDVDGKYKLKFFVALNGSKITDIYFSLDEELIYLVKMGDKSADFEYYYAIYILENVLGNELDYSLKFEKVIEEKVMVEFSDPANIIFNYGDFSFNKDKNYFILEGNAYNIDYYEELQEIKFKVSFSKNKNNRKKVWYYGDSSFDYISWDIKIKK